MATLNSLKRTGARPYRRVGRGQGSKRGKQSGRGGKGQTARAGHKVRPEIRDMIKKLPKRRGYGKNRGRTVNPDRVQAISFSLTRLDKHFEAGATISPQTLRTEGFLGRKNTPVKIVGGESSKKFSFQNVIVTASAKAAIEKAGGTISS